MNNYKEGEELLVYQGPLIYKAKCIAIRENGENTESKEYLVHYAGWNKKWDEWVDDSRLLKLDEENLKLQTSLKIAHDNSKKKKKKAPEKRKTVATTKTAVSSTNENSPKTQASTSDVIAKKTSSGNAPSSPSVNTNDNEIQKKQRGTVEDENENVPNIQIDIPEELKPPLADDWDLINRQHKLPTTPANVTVATILEDYQKSKIRVDTKPNKASSVEAVVSDNPDLNTNRIIEEESSLQPMEIKTEDEEWFTEDVKESPDPSTNRNNEEDSSLQPMEIKTEDELWFTDHVKVESDLAVSNENPNENEEVEDDLDALLENVYRKMEKNVDGVKNKDDE